MTDNKIKKALEYRLKVGGGTRIDKEVLDLINRLQAENERLEKGSLKEAMIFNSKTIANVKAEAYKEFAELLKKHSYYDPKDQRKVVAETIIDHYLKEKVGEDK